MCTHKHYIINSNGKRILVNCGHCPACLQQKAMSCAARIRRNVPSDGSIMTLFATLTYSNTSVPYIYEDELMTAPRHSVVVGSTPAGLDKVEDYVSLSIRRNARFSRLLHGGFNRGNFLLSDIDIPSSFHRETLTRLRNDSVKRKRVGVIYFPDIQMFFKRLRQNLKRKYKYEYPISYFVCAEYGSKTCRPHFHILLFVRDSIENFNMWKRAISEAWPFDASKYTKGNIEIARDAASYVSSYVNCSSSVPSVFQTNALRPKHSMSQGFGFALECLQLPKILEAYKRRDLHIDVCRIREGVPVVERILLPKYALYRFFPKFKGYSRLTYDEIVSLLYSPASVYRYADTLRLSKVQCHRVKVSLENKLKYALSLGIDKFDYIETYANIYTLYNSNLLKDFYQGQTLHNLFYSYDNIIDYYDNSVSCPTLDDMMVHLPSNFHHISDPNQFPANIAETLYYTDLYHKYDKSKRVNNSIYSQFNDHL